MSQIKISDMTETTALGADDLFEENSITNEQIAYIVNIVKNTEISKKDKIITIKRCIPEGFMQRRVWRLDYKTIRNIMIQRKSHILPHWKIFINELLKQVKHPEFLKI